MGLPINGFECSTASSPNRPTLIGTVLIRFCSRVLSVAPNQEGRRRSVRCVCGVWFVQPSSSTELYNIGNGSPSSSGSDPTVQPINAYHPYSLIRVFPTHYPLPLISHSTVMHRLKDIYSQRLFTGASSVTGLEWHWWRQWRCRRGWRRWRRRL